MLKIDNVGVLVEYQCRNLGKINPKIVQLFLIQEQFFICFREKFLVYESKKEKFPSFNREFLSLAGQKDDKSVAKPIVHLSFITIVELE